MSLEKVLFVDDEEDILNGVKRSLYRDYELHVALGAESGLIAIRDKGPFAVVVSDMRMPGMSGATFLAKVRTLQPESTRMLLTGYSDADAAAEAINKGHIFQFLTKPCPREDLLKALKAGVDKYNDVKAEKALLEGTLLGSIRALSEVLSAVNPSSFERSIRMSACVRHLIALTPLEEPWQVEAAALLSQLGCMVLPSELVRAAHRGMPLSTEDQARYALHPQTASELLVHIPRMQGVAWLIRNQDGTHSEPDLEGFHPTQAADLKLGAEMLRMAIAFDTLWLQGIAHAQAIQLIRKSVRSFPHSLMDALESMKPFEQALKPKVLPVALLDEGMIVDEDLINQLGALMVGSGQPISKALLIKLREYVETGKIKDQIRVLA